METNELKRQLIDMIESIDDEELLYLMKEDLVFHVTSKAIMSEETDIDAASHAFNDYSIASPQNKEREKDSGTSFFY
ncbi:hypothetical protein BH10BAC2_BH10BAC2_27840 [soil metagenome]